MLLTAWKYISGMVRQESAAATALVQAFIALGIAFAWWSWTPAQTGAVVGIVAALLGMFVRSQVTPLHPFRATTGQPYGPTPRTIPGAPAGPVPGRAAGPTSEPPTRPGPGPAAEPTAGPATRPIPRSAPGAAAEPPPPGIPADPPPPRFPADPLGGPFEPPEGR